MTENMDDIRRNFQDMETEALVDEYLHAKDDYTPEAFQLLEVELNTRGYTKEKLARHFGDGVPEGVEHDKLVDIQTLHNPETAVELQDFLEDHGIPSYFSGEIYLLVHQDHAERSQHLIKEYFDEPEEEEFVPDED